MVAAVRSGQIEAQVRNVSLALDPQPVVTSDTQSKGETS